MVTHVVDFERSAYSAANCSVARTLEIVGEKWTLLVLREAYYGARRFGDLQGRLGIARNVLTDRLATIVDAGVLHHVPYQEPGARTRNEYRLTPAGRELFPVLVALLQWGDAYLADPEGPAVVLEHRECGHAVRAVLQCTAGHQPLGLGDTQPRPDSGARTSVH